MEIPFFLLRYLDKSCFEQKLRDKTQKSGNTEFLGYMRGFVLDVTGCPGSFENFIRGSFFYFCLWGHKKSLPAVSPIILTIIYGGYMVLI